MSAIKGRVTSRTQRAAKQEEYAKMKNAYMDQYEKGGTSVTAGTYTKAGILKALNSASGVSGANELISKLLEAQKTESKTLSKSSAMSNFFKVSQSAWY
jgi:hypothetical protein